MHFGPRLGASLLVLPLLLLTAAAHGQSAPPASSGGVQWSGPASGTDVVYLKDGQQIRGTLTELRVGESATIRLPQGQSATARWEGIARIERNGQPLDTTAMQAQAPSPAPPPVPARQPETMPYNSDQPVPAGYHVESKVRLGLVIPGAILTGIGTVAIIAVESGDADRNVKTAADVVLGVLFLGPGLPLLLVGLLSPKKFLRRDSAFWNLPSPEKQPFHVGFAPMKDGGGFFTIGRQF